MKYLYPWLKELYPQIPSLEKLPDWLIQLGHDIEHIEELSYPGIVVGEIKTVALHPEADRLSLVQVYDGTTTHDVVCGAPDLTTGQKVAYAQVGATIPCGLTIRVAKVRGIASHGMLCAEDELGIGPSHASLLSLPQDALVGEPITAFVAPDAIIHLDITSNRGDVLSHFGLARDLKAGIEQEVLTLTLPQPSYGGETSEYVSIQTIHADASALCLGLVTSDTSAPATPLLMQSRLHLLGHKSINLATDITNYLLLAYGQPLHAYDLQTLPKPVTFSVRRAHAGEVFTGLNSKRYTLSPQALTISVGDTPVALAGILGGEGTKVTDATKQVVFESAHFYPKPIRLMSRGLNCLTDSSKHWERGVDPKLTEKILAHAQALYADLTQGKAYKPMQKTNLPATEPITTRIPYKQLTEHLGLSLDSTQIKKIITGFGAHIEQETNETVSVTPPSWRHDLALAEDYAEEIVRSIGVDAIPKKPLAATVPQWKRSKYWRQESIKDVLVALGSYEITTYPFMHHDEVGLFPTKNDTVELRSPVLEGKTFMRSTLIPGTLTAIGANPEAPKLLLFEIAKIYTPAQEIEMICISVSSNNQSEIDRWWQNLFERLRFPVSSWMSRITVIPENIKTEYKIRKALVTILTLPVQELVTGKQYENPTVTIPDLDSITYEPLSKFQTSRRDIAMIVNRSHTVEAIQSDLKQLDPQIGDVELFDTYTDAKLGEDNYSVAFHIFYQASDRTLTTDEINSLHQKVEQHIEEHYHGTIR